MIQGLRTSLRSCFTPGTTGKTGGDRIYVDSVASAVWSSNDDDPAGFCLFDFSTDGPRRLVTTEN